MTTIVISGTEIKAHDTGRVAYDGSLAHIYKLSPGSQFPGEVIVIGPFTYTNANVQASLQSPEVPPWTKLDTRKLSAKAAANQTDELSHVLAPAYLAFGASHVTLRRRVADGAVFWARIDPKLVLSKAACGTPREDREGGAKRLPGRGLQRAVLGGLTRPDPPRDRRVGDAERHAGRDRHQPTARSARR